MGNECKKYRINDYTGRDELQRQFKYVKTYLIYAKRLGWT